MTPDHGELLYEGKAKRVFASTDPDRVLVEFKNDATAFNACLLYTSDAADD